MKFICTILLLIFTNPGINQEVTEIYFGGIFDESAITEDNSSLTDEQAFQFAVFFANKEFGNETFQFKANTRTTKSENNEDQLRGPFKAKISTCGLLGEKSQVIFGPKHEEDINIVQSVCDYKNIAHVINRWVFDPSDYRSTINFYPHSKYLTSAYFSILKLSGWKSFTLFYDDNESLLRLGDLIRMSKSDGIIVTVKQLDEIGEGVYRTTLKDAVRSGERNYIFDCKIDILEEVLRQAQQVGLMTSLYSYIITNLDLQTIDLEPFKYSEANITGIRIFNPSTELVALKSDAIIKGEFNPNFDVSKMRTETVLIIDAVSVLAKIFSTKLSLHEIDSNPITCESFKSARHGFTITNHVKTSRNMEMTGLIEFDGDGVRNNFNLDIFEVVEDGINNIGTWNASKGLISSRFTAQNVDEDSDSLKNKTFRIITCLTDPYCMLKETSVQLFGNDRFEGFAIDLIHELSVMEGFNYTFIIRDDKKNGNKNPLTGQWSGMIGDVMDGSADLAITDLTITSEREEAVDFTSPFMNLGISILAKKPGNAPPSFFSFADPFALDTWIGLALAYALVTISFFILGRLSQDEWTNPYPCIEEPEFLINQFSLQNSAWFAVGALMQQGTELGPIGISTRMVSGMWWFFTLIMVSSYTANLAAFLATENTIELFSDVHSLVANQARHSIRFGAKANGATESFFKGKDNDVYTAIADYMAEHPEDMVKENKDGVKLAEEATYAFFMESLSIEYETQRHCELQQYGKLLDDKGYGIAMRKNSTYRKRLSTAILKLQTSGELDKLKRKWWEEKRGGGQCNTDSGQDGPTPALGVLNLQGVFFVTLGGTILAIFFVIAQMLLATKRMAQKANIPFKEALALEWKAIIDFNSDVKPSIRAAKSKSRSKSSKETEASQTNNVNNNIGFLPSIINGED